MNGCCGAYVARFRHLFGMWTYAGALCFFFHEIAQPEIGLQLASIASLDSAVCSILSAVLDPARVVAREPTVATIFRRIHRDEAKHVRLSRHMAAELAPKKSINSVAERTRLGLAGILARHGAALECLGVDARWLFTRLGRVPDGLFRL